MSDKHVLSARLPDALLSGLDQVARERNRKRGEIVREAIEMYLATYADYRIALERLQDAGDPVQTEREFLDELGWDL